MRDLFKVGLLAAMALALLLAAGCGDDDPAGPTEKQVGDLNSPEFEALIGCMDSSEVFTGMILDDIFNVMDAVFAGGLGAPGDRVRPITVNGVEADSVYLTYHPTSQYWYWYLHLEDTGDTVTIIDSVQFLHATGPVQWPDSALLTGVATGAQLHGTFAIGAEIEAAQLLTVMGDIVNKGDVTFNGTQYIDMLMVADSCTITMDMGMTATEIALNITHVDSTGGCPESGVFSHQGTLGVVCTGEGALNFSDSWTIVQTFTGDEGYTVVAENSTTRWEFSGSCLGDVTK